LNSAEQDAPAHPRTLRGPALAGDPRVVPAIGRKPSASGTIERPGFDYLQ